jgi:hypothetical protein
MCHIKINLEEKALVNTKTAQILRPSCFDTLAVYHAYLISTNEHASADDLLKKVFKGEKVITDMINQAQLHHLI